MQQLQPEQTLKDLAAAVAVVRNSGRIGTVGFCWGGALSYLSACELPVACAVVYYGKADIFLDKRPKCPVLYHFGTEDKSISLSDVEKIKAAHPQGVFYLYEGAGHGFSCDQRASYQPEAAALARTRTLEFLSRYLAGQERAPS
jgi:carboxymethylenebutenolidase